MKRRKLIRYAGASFLAVAGSTLLGSRPRSVQAQGGGVTVRSLGHTCFYFTGGGLRILVNPFRTIGCTQGYRLPRVEADLVMISSQLWDEGAAEDLPGNPKILFEPGVYELEGFRIQGVGIPHDREGGRRFGTNIIWKWQQGGVQIVHLGGAAAPIEIEQKILLGQPDLLLLPVGGGPKAYNPEEALAAMQTLNPKVAIPTQYLTAAADPDNCDLVEVDQFIALAQDYSTSRIQGNTISFSPGSLPPEGTLIRVLGYPT